MLYPLSYEGGGETNPAASTLYGWHHLAAENVINDALNCQNRNRTREREL